MLRGKFTRSQLQFAWHHVSHLDYIDPVMLTYIRNHLFGAGRQEFLNELGQNITPYANRLPNEYAVFVDSVGRLYFPHDDSRDEDYSIHRDTEIIHSVYATDTWCVKIDPLFAQDYNKTRAFLSQPYDPNSPLSAPLVDETVHLTGAKDGAYTVRIKDVLYRRDASFLVRFDGLLPTGKTQIGDHEFFKKKLTAAIKLATEEIGNLY